MTAFPNLYFKDQFGDSTIATILGGSYGIGLNFIVDPANGNGLGIRSLKVTGQNPDIVKNVFMHTTATPAAGNPNPLAGFILIQFNESYLGYGGGSFGFVSPLSGSNISISAGVTQGQAYAITSLGTTTAAQWQAIGLPLGITPAVGAAFIASVTGDGVGTGTVQVPSASGITGIEVVGDPNQTCDVAAANAGAWLVIQCLSGSTLTAPATGTVIGLVTSMAGPVGQPEV
jgi:hypothetical protein